MVPAPVGAVALEGDILVAVACHIPRSNNQGVREVHIQDTLRGLQPFHPGVNNSRTDKACIQAAA